MRAVLPRRSLYSYRYEPRPFSILNNLALADMPFLSADFNSYSSLASFTVSLFSKYFVD